MASPWPKRTISSQSGSSPFSALPWSLGPSWSAPSSNRNQASDIDTRIRFPSPAPLFTGVFSLSPVFASVLHQPGASRRLNCSSIDPIIIAHLGSLGARSRTAAAATTAIIRAATAAVGTKAGGFDRAGAGLAAAVADVVGVIAAVDRAVGFCRCPLQFLAQILIHEIRQRRISQHSVRPQLPQHKPPLPSLS